MMILRSLLYFVMRDYVKLGAATCSGCGLTAYGFVAKLQPANFRFVKERFWDSQLPVALEVIER